MLQKGSKLCVQMACVLSRPRLIRSISASFMFCPLLSARWMQRTSGPKRWNNQEWGSLDNTSKEIHLLTGLLREQDIIFHYVKPLKCWRLFTKPVCIFLTKMLNADFLYSTWKEYKFISPYLRCYIIYRSKICLWVLGITNNTSVVTKIQGCNFSFHIHKTSYIITLSFLIHL